MTLFDAEEGSAPAEPQVRRRNRDRLIAAYAAELEARPPVGCCAGDSAQAAATRGRLAAKDVDRLYAAAARLGCTISLTPMGVPPAERGGHDR